MLAPLLLAATSVLVVSTNRGDQPLAIYAPDDSGAAAPHMLVLVLSGEGGWRAFDDRLATWLQRAGYWVGGVDCLHYFMKPQDDRGALAADVRRYADAIVRAAGHGEDARVVLAGYSFGADLAPWIAGAPARDRRIAGLVMIGPDATGSLEFRVSELLGFSSKEHVFDTGRALADVEDLPVLFIHGAKDDASTAPDLAAGFGGRKELVVVAGATHHFSGHEDELERAIVGGLARLLAR